MNALGDCITSFPKMASSAKFNFGKGESEFIEYDQGVQAEEMTCLY